MKALFTSPTVLVTLAANLALGNLILVMMNSGDMRAYRFMALWYSLAVVLLLLGGFRLIKPASRWWTAVLLGLFFTLLVPFAGSFMWGMALALPKEVLFVALKKSLAFSFLGTIFGAVLGIPFITGNMLAFFLHLRKLQRSSAQVACGQP